MTASVGLRSGPIRWDRWFLAIGVPFGALLLVFLPPANSADEANHLARIDQIARGHLVAPRDADHFATARVDGCLNSFLTRLAVSMFDEHWRPADALRRYGCVRAGTMGISNVSLNTPVSYGPAVTGYVVGRLLGGVLLGFWLAADLRADLLPRPLLAGRSDDARGQAVPRAHRSPPDGRHARHDALGRPRGDLSRPSLGGTRPPSAPVACRRARSRPDAPAVGVVRRVPRAAGSREEPLRRRRAPGVSRPGRAVLVTATTRGVRGRGARGDHRGVPGVDPSRPQPGSGGDPVPSRRLLRPA